MEVGEERGYAPYDRPLASASTGYLMGDLFRQVRELAGKEIRLARAEAREIVRARVKMVVGFVAAGACALLGLGFIAGAAVLLLARAMPVWVAALIVGAAELTAAAILLGSAKSKRVQKPFERTRRTLKENFRWMNERVA